MRADVAMSPAGKHLHEAEGAGTWLKEDQLSTAAPSPALTFASWSPMSPNLSPHSGPLGAPEEGLETPPEFVLTGLEELRSSVVGLLAGLPMPPTPSGTESSFSCTSEPLLPPGLEGSCNPGAAASEAARSSAPASPPPGLHPEAEALLPAGTTTAMLRNIPNKYTQEALLARLHMLGYSSSMDFIYVPIDFKNRCNFGYAFLNFRSAEACARFASEFHGAESRAKLPGFQSRKVCEVSPARHQGLEENIRRLRDSSVMAELVGLGKPEWLPKILGEHGEDLGFPLPAATAAAASVASGGRAVAAGAVAVSLAKQRTAEAHADRAGRGPHHTRGSRGGGKVRA